MTPERIDDPDDPRIAPYRAVRERDLVGRAGLFIAEGEVVLEKLAAAPRHRAISILIAEKRLEKLAPFLVRYPPDVPVYLAAQRVMDAITGFPIHRGVLALGRRAEPLDPAALLAGLPARALVVAMIGLSNHDNVGGVFRNAAAFGVGAVLNDAATCDPLYRKAIRVSVGATLLVPFAQLAENADPLAILQAAGFEALALSPTGGEPIADARRPARCALIVGAEGPGLPADLLSRARRVTIPMAAGFDSLNVAVASGVALHRLA